MRIHFKELERVLRRLDGRPYRLYKRLYDIKITYEYGVGYLTKIQGDPHAPPSTLEVKIPKEVHQLPSEYLSNFKYYIPISDYVTRHIYEITRKLRRKCGTGNSCYIGIPRPGPWILMRSSAEIQGNDLTIRLYVGLPAVGRRISSKNAIKLLGNDVNEVIKYVVSAVNTNFNALKKHVELYLDHEFLRSWIASRGYIAFIPNGAILPRESSISLKPLRNAVKFKSPESMKVKVKLPSGKVVSGMALPRGLIVLTGGAYHGKTTLLNSIIEGIYNHIEGDGREFLVSNRSTMYVRAEDGRMVTCVDISNLIGRLPNGTDTSRFSTLNASGSTSMAASLSESLELGVKVLLIDEDTSATNLLYKDEYMTKIIVDEPIKPLSYVLRSLINTFGISLVIVSSASSSFIPCATKVIEMIKYEPKDITEESKRLMAYRSCSDLMAVKPVKERIFGGIKDLKRVKASGFRLNFRYQSGEEFQLDLRLNPRIVEPGQVKLICKIITKLAKVRKPFKVRDIVNYVNSELRSKKFKAFTDIVTPDLTMVDGLDVVWTLNRVYKAVFNIPD